MEAFSKTTNKQSHRMDSRQKRQRNAARAKAMYNYSGACCTILTAVHIDKVNTQPAPQTKGAHPFLQRTQSSQGSGCCRTGRPRTFATAALVGR